MGDLANTTRNRFLGDEPSDGDLVVLNEILSAFRKLEPESRERMLNTVATFLGIGLHSVMGILTAPHQGSVTSNSENSFSEDRSVSPKQFMLEKQPQNDVEKVACLAYYLTHYRGIQHFKALDISKLNTEAAQTKFANANTAVNNATVRNYLVQATKGSKQLSASGEQFVLALPDRQKARNIMMGARPRRKARKISEQQAEDQE